MGGDLRLYDVTIGQHKTRMQLNDADAKAMGDSAVPVEPGKAPAVAPEPEPAEPKSRLVTPNKMRGTEHKRGDN